MLQILGTDSNLTGKLSGYSSAFVLIEAVAIFLAFLNSKPITGNKAIWINRIARHSFSVYIIHFAMNGVLWTNILHINRWIDQAAAGAAVVIVSVVLVYILHDS